ncbi:MAG: hypothetical protein JXB05_08905 [Myxococcaceae bacterium]|nr:hypothetical protein [Myxococcaceae bacterium]
MRNLSLTTLGRPLVGLVFTVLIALAPAACRKEAAAPSEAYEQAHKRFSKLYAQKLDGAFLAPEMDEIEAQLEQVPADSLDAQSARELKQRITEGRARAQANQQAQEDALAAARAVDPSALQPVPTRPTEPTPAPAGPRDAGTSAAGPVEGTPASELTAGYLGCFQRGKTVNVDGRGPRESWEMSDRARCSQSFPRFVGQVVLIEDGKVLTVLPKSAFRMTWQLPDGGTVGADGGR